MTSDLNLGNKALKEKNYAQALKHYHAVMAKQPELGRMIKANISLVEKKLASIGSGALAIEVGRQAVESIDGENIRVRGGDRVLGVDHRLAEGGGIPNRPDKHVQLAP